MSLSVKSQAQHDPLFTQYLNNSVLQNPAYAGSNNTIQGMIMTRNQWVGFEGAPKTNAVSFNMPWVKYNVGVGGSFYQDEIGPEKEFFTAVDLSYRVKLGESMVNVLEPVKRSYNYVIREREQKYETFLSFGLKTSVARYHLNVGEDDGQQPGDGELVDISRRRMVNFGFGMYLYNPRYYVSLSVPQLLGFHMAGDQFKSEKKKFDKLYYYLSAGYVMTLSPYVKFKPTTMMRYVAGAPLSMDVNANFLFLERFWAGIGYRIGDSVIGNIELGLTKNLKIGYSYDMTTTDMSRYSGGSHEVTLKFDFRIKTLAPCKPYF